MKKIYLDIMEKSLSAYSIGRIRDYMDEVKRNGLKEHGFPRLGANIGILLGYGRCQEMKDIFIEIMDICCNEMPRCKAANDFSIREVCCCLMLLKGKNVVSEEKLKEWIGKIANFDPWNFYTAVPNDKGQFIGNWALFAAVSDYIRGICCGIDTSEFVDWQLPSQIANLDCNDMYQDEPPICNHMVYDIMPRLLMTFLISAGYNGKYAKRIEQALDRTVDITLKMQSVTGELAFGGRSNQFLNNTAMLISYFEIEAVRFAKKGDMNKAGELRAAAVLAIKNLYDDLSLNPISHIKNRYDISTKIGCEVYGYFNKYMITVASNIYMGLFFLDETIKATELLNKNKPYIISTSDNFHKTFVNAGGYMLEFDTKADFHYDANGLGRVHKNDCNSKICLSVPFSPNPHYTLEGSNALPMSICCFVKDGDKTILGAEAYAEYTLVDSACSNDNASVTFDCKLSDDITVTEEYTVNKRGVDIKLTGAENIGLMIPVFDFDGNENTETIIEEKSISVRYDNTLCKYTFDGVISKDFKYFYNRNGRYKVFEMLGNSVHIDITNG